MNVTLRARNTWKSALPLSLSMMAAAVLTLTSCGASDTATSSPSTSASRSSASGTPSPRNTSPFCLDLSTFQVVLVVYRGEAGKAVRGEPLDFKELRRLAANIGRYGKTMRPSAPPDIAKDFATVLDAVADSVSHLKEGGSLKAVLDPLYGNRNKAAFEKVDNYKCH